LKTFETCSECWPVQSPLFYHFEKRFLEAALEAGVRGILSLSEAMAKRAEKYGGYGKLNVFLASKEDGYLFKAITSRPFPRDYEDLVTLQQSGLDWKAVAKEYEEQVKGKPIEENLVKKLAELKKQGIINPLMKIVKQH